MGFFETALQETRAGDYERAARTLSTWVVRVGKTISAESASKIQVALDHLADAQSTHQQAVLALKQLVALSTSPMDASESPSNDELIGKATYPRIQLFQDHRRD